MSRTVAVLGAGSWGTALAVHLGRLGHDVRLWARDAAVWTGADEAKWLDWLDIACDQKAHAEPFRRLAEAVRQAGFTHAVVLGMGGSSLFPEVLAMSNRILVMRGGLIAGEVQREDFSQPHLLRLMAGIEAKAA